MISSGTLFALACLVVGIAIPVVPVILVGIRARRQLTTSSAYREVARGMGLDVDTRGLSLHGVLHDRPLWIGEVLVGQGPERRREVHGVIGFRHPLGLGVSIRHRTRRRGRRERGGETLGSAEVDKALYVTSTHDPGLEAVRSESVVRMLEHLTDRVQDVQLSDERVRVRLRRPPSTSSQLGQLVDLLEAAARVMEEAAAEAARPDVVCAWRPRLQALAASHGLTLDTERVQLDGALAGWPVQVVPNHVGGRWCLWLGVQFDPDVDTGLRVHPQRPDEDSADGQDIVVGHPAFDDAFVVKGYDPEAVRTRLDATVRDALLALSTLGPVSMDDHGLVVRHLSPGEVDEALRHAQRVVGANAPTTGEVRIIDVG